MKKAAILFLMGAFLPGNFSPALAQTGQPYAIYSLSSPTEKNFEYEPFFFQPAYIQPDLAGPFADLAPGMIDEPLLNMSLNPAFVTKLNGNDHYVHLDIKTNRTSDPGPQVVALPEEPCPNCYIPLAIYSFPADEKRKIASPRLSFAYLSKPFRNSDFYMGVTYQMLSIGDDYYSVPSESYQVTADGAGFQQANHIAASPQNKIENMNQDGHFLSVWTGFELSESASLGFKAGRGRFSRRGEANVQQMYPYYFSTGLLPGQDANVNLREQNYGYWDFSGGIIFSPGADLSTSVSAGYLTGGIDQTTDLTSFYTFQNRDIDIGPEWYVSSDLNLTDQTWDKSGHTFYGSLYADYELSPGKNLRLILQNSYTDNDLEMNGSTSRSSYSSIRSLNQGTAQNSLYQSSSANTAGGTGDGSLNRTRAGIIMQQQLGSGLTTLSFGLQFNRNTRTIETAEEVTFQQSAFWHNTLGSTQADTFSTATLEEKTLTWDFTGTVHSYNLPVLLQSRMNGWLSFRSGINPSIRTEKFDERIVERVSRQVYEENGKRTVQTDLFRSSGPNSSSADFEMPLLASLEFHPTHYLDFTVTSIPVLFRQGKQFLPDNLQFMIGISVRP